MRPELPAPGAGDVAVRAGRQVVLRQLRQHDDERGQERPERRSGVAADQLRAAGELEPLDVGEVADQVEQVRDDPVAQRDLVARPQRAGAAVAARPVGAAQPGVGEALNQSRGAALFAIPLLSTQRPERARNVGGLVTESLFSQNTGLAVWDVDPASGPINDVRYDKNQLFEATFGDKVYFNSLVEPAGASVATLNRLTVSRGSRGTTDKSAVDNVRLFSAPVAGTLLAAPSLVATGAPASGETLLHYAWSGRAATLNGQALSSRHGQVVAGPGTHTLVVDGTQVAAVVLPAARCPAGAACLAGGRFQVRIPGAHLLAQEVDTAYFSLKGGGTFAVQVRHDTKWHAWFVQGVSNVSHLSDLSRHSVEISDTVSGTVHVWSDLAPVLALGVLVALLLALGSRLIR